jgi:hypothetical protein
VPAQKLSYKVDVDTGGAVRDLARLGKAGGDAGQDIADGFDKAESASSKALKALSSELDNVEQDAKGLAEAVSAIKANLTVDVDDSKIEGFASDLKNKMGVAFDAVTADAKEFADVLERGIDMSKTTGELKGVGTELDHVRGEADQSRSVLANMAGNTTQTAFSSLGGTIGDIGMGLGQLAEYATEGNIGLKGLASVAGPLAALSAASIVINGISKGLADLKERQEAYTQQQTDFNDALRETGSVQDTVNQMLEDNVALSAAPELNWWQGMLDDLPVLTGLVDETTTAQSGLVEAMAAAGITSQEFAYSLDHGLGPVIAFQAAVKDMFDTGQITQEQYDLLIDQQALYSETALTAQVQQQNLNKVFGDGTGALTAYNKALPTPEALEKIAAEQKALADAAEEAAASIRQQADAAEEASAIMSSAEWGTASLDAATTAMSEFFAESDAGLHGVGDLSAAYDGLHESLHEAFGEGNLDNFDRLIPDMTTPEGRAVLDALDEVGTAIIPSIAKAFANSHGDINKFKSDMQGIYDTTLVSLSNELGISEEAVAALLAQIGLTPDNFETMYELNGTEDAKVKLQLLQSAIDKLPEYVQLQVQQQIILGDYTGALATVQAAFARGAKVPVHVDSSPADAEMAAWRKRQANTIVRVPVGTYSVAGTTYGKTGGGRSVEPAGVGVEPMAADTGTAVSTYTTTVPTVTIPTPSITVNLSAGVVGNRWDLQRWVRSAVRSQERLGRPVTATVAA